jgi:small glutamine-rich tetratricopeptide repeat-containing protein alpha
MRYWMMVFLLWPLLSTAQSGDAPSIYGEGVRAYYAEDYQTALIKYSEAIRLKPKTLGYIYNRGLAYLKLNDKLAAGKDFVRVTEIDSYYVDAWYQLGMIQMDARKYDSASVLFEHWRCGSIVAMSTLYTKWG